jgi:methylmalonyl-CoA mutase N-terminal domain/subunit
MKERFKVNNEKAMMCRFHVQTGGSTLAAQQVENNIVRTTIQALSAILGGAQSLHTNAYDEALALPTDRSAKIALRTQQVIAHETGLADYIDPLGNSEQIEILTNKTIDEARLLINQIDELGGAVEAIENGWMQNEISKSAYIYQKSIDEKKQTIIGLNKFTEDDNIDINLQKIDQDAVDKQIDQVKKLKSERDNLSVNNKIEGIESCALTNDNLVPKIIEAARSECTLGEIADALRKSFGEYNQN